MAVLGHQVTHIQPRISEEGRHEESALGMIALAMAVVPVPSAMGASITGQAAIAGIDTYSATGVAFINPGVVFCRNRWVVADAVAINKLEQLHLCQRDEHNTVHFHQRSN